MAYSELQANHAAFVQWCLADRSDNAELRHAKEAIAVAISDYLTEKQKCYFMHYFLDNMTIPEIAVMYGVNKSTVSRTLNRTLSKLYSYVRFASPRLLHSDEIITNIRNRRVKNGKTNIQKPRQLHLR